MKPSSSKGRGIGAAPSRAARPAAHPVAGEGGLGQARLDEALLIRLVGCQIPEAVLDLLDLFAPGDDEAEGGEGKAGA